jgi:hypothetical protein
VLNGRVNVINELGGVWKEAVVAFFEAIYQYLPGGRKP